MLDSPEPAPRADALQALLEQPAVRAVLPTLGQPLPDDIRRWLGQLLLLQGVPFNNLVADSRMLPPESIRFFFLDQNWLDSLLNGALSIAQLSEPDTAMLDILRDSIRELAIGAARQERGQRRLMRRSPAALAAARLVAAASQGRPRSRAVGDGNDADANAAGAPAVWTGLLLRSTVVADFPGLELAAYADAGRAQPLDLLRVERLAPTVLLAIFDGIAREIDIARPTQALHFGVEEVPGPVRTDPLQVFLRGIGGVRPPGQQLPGDPAVPAPLREDRHGRRVLDLTKLRGHLQTGLQAAYAPNQAPPLNPGAFAIQMLTGSERQRFAAQAPHQEPPDGG